MVDITLRLGDLIWKSRSIIVGCLVLQSFQVLAPRVGMLGPKAVMPTVASRARRKATCCLWKSVLVEMLDVEGE